MKAKGSTRAAPWAGLLCVLLLVILGFIGIPRAVLYITGEQVTAQVTDCHTETKRGRRGRTTTVTVCNGIWTTKGGRQYSGVIEGANDEHLGRQIPVRVRGDEALLDEPSLLWPAGAFCLVLVAGIAGAGYLITRRRDRAGDAGPTGPIPPAPGGPAGPWPPSGTGPYPPVAGPPSTHPQSWHPQQVYPQQGHPSQPGQQPTGSYAPYGQQPPTPPPDRS